MVRTRSPPGGRARHTAGSRCSTRNSLMRALDEYARSRTAAGSRRATGFPRGVSPTIRPAQGVAEAQITCEVAGPGEVAEWLKAADCETGIRTKRRNGGSK